MSAGTMRRADLLALAERVEAAEGADDQMDCDIAAAIGFDHWSPADWEEAKAEETAAGLPPPMMLPPPPRYTASLDAAASLVPAGSLYCVRTLWDGAKTAGYATVNRYTPEPRTFVNDTAGVSATPALALTAAALRALAEEADDAR